MNKLIIISLILTFLGILMLKSGIELKKVILILLLSIMLTCILIKLLS